MGASILLARCGENFILGMEVSVATIHVRNVPEEMAAGVKTLARAHRRSMEAEMLELIARAISGNTRPPARHVNFDLIKAVDLGEVEFEPMNITFQEPEL